VDDRRDATPPGSLSTPAVATMAELPPEVAISTTMGSLSVFTATPFQGSQGH
jgi:hypothetical protein